MNVDVQGLAGLFFTLCERRSAEGQQTEKHASSRASPAGGKRVASTRIILPLLKLVPIRPKLIVDVVLQWCWFSHIWEQGSREQWNRAGKQTYRHAYNVCGMCGGNELEWPVECHAAWQDDETTYVQSLVRLRAVCPACHAMKHGGWAEMQGIWQRLSPREHV